MSTPEQPATPALTRKQMRDIRNTGATPIISGDSPTAEPPTRSPSPTRPRHRRSPETAGQSRRPHVAAPLPRAAEPVVVA